MKNSDTSSQLVKCPSGTEKNDGMDATEFKEYRLTAKGQEAGIQLAQGGRLEQVAGAKYSKAGEVGILTPSGFGQQYGIDNTAQTRTARGGTFNPQTEMADVFKTLNTATPTEVEQTFIFTDPNTGKPLEDGRTITTREGDGMVDLLGDTRLLQDFETRTATAEDAAQGLAEEVGDQFVAPSADTRRAGFDDKGNFLGLSVLAEDIQRGNLSRQREADLQDAVPLVRSVLRHHGGLQTRHGIRHARREGLDRGTKGQLAQRRWNIRPRASPIPRSPSRSIASRTHDASRRSAWSETD